MEGNEIVGSLTESVVLNRLLDDPDAGKHAVSENMGKPLPVVEESLPLSGLSSLLREAPGAVLVDRGERGLAIITKSDLIEALASRQK